jgi:hypothetical protein
LFLGNERRTELCVTGNVSALIPDRASQFCYYSSPNADKSSTRVDIAVDETPLSVTALTLVPESKEALKKCQWWRA